MRKREKTQVQRWRGFLNREMEGLGLKLFFEENLTGHKLQSDYKPWWVWQTYWYMPGRALMSILKIDYNEDGIDDAQAYCFFQISDYGVNLKPILARIPRSPVGSECHGLGISINDYWTDESESLERAIRFYRNCVNALRKIVGPEFVDSGLNTEYWTPHYAEKYYRPHHDEVSYQKSREHTRMVISKFPKDFPYRKT